MPIQVEFDAKGSVEATSATPSWAHECSGAKVLYVISAVESNVGVVSAAYDSIPLTIVDAQASGNPRLELWKLDNPHPGGHLVEVTMSSSVCGVWGSFSLRNVDIITGEIGFLKDTDTGGDQANNVLNVPVGGMAFDAYSIRNHNAWTGGAGQTIINQLVRSCALLQGHGNSYEAGDGTIAMDMGWNNSTEHCWMVWGVGPGKPIGNQVMIIA